MRGYRLVAVLVETGIAFLHVGSHDECDHWIKNNFRLEPNLDKKRNKITEITAPVREDEPEGVAADPCELEPDYDALILSDITDRDLRRIFGGLCGR